MVPLITSYLQMACETFSFADELLYNLGLWPHMNFFGRPEQNWFNHLYESGEENPRPAFGARLENCFYKEVFYTPKEVPEYVLEGLFLVKL